MSFGYCRLRLVLYGWLGSRNRETAARTDYRGVETRLRGLWLSRCLFLECIHGCEVYGGWKREGWKRV